MRLTRTSLYNLAHSFCRAILAGWQAGRVRLGDAEVGALLQVLEGN
jgi:hypothetical protein